MKLSAITAILVASSAIAGADQVAHYTFDVDGAATVGTDATLAANATISTTAVLGAGSLQVDTPVAETGNDGAVSGNSFDWGATGFNSDVRSVAFWVKAAVTQVDSNPTMVSLGSGAGTGNRFDIRLAGGALRLELCRVADTPPQASSMTIPGTMSPWWSPTPRPHSPT